ncbi:MAG: helix-hairpin-helix domain-containing protein [Luteolibacter sp.]
MIIKPFFHFLRVFATACFILEGANGEGLTALKNCKRVPTEWADGDSFLIKTEDGTEHTVRLYGADCFEWHVTDESDARRLREQRRYFGISGFGGSPQASIAAAKDLGKLAADEIAVALKAPFTVHTAYSDAKGDGKYKRIYAFVMTASGEDLSEILVSKGLARAFGVYRQTQTGRSSKEYRAYLQDVELRAAKRGVGAWAKTDWDLLPNERQAERQESEELSLATSGQKLPAGEKINPNTAARDQLMLLPGVGEITANRIIEARPYKIPRDLLNVEGIGPKTLERLEPFLELP